MSEALSHYRRKHLDVTFKTRGSRKNSGQYVDIFETDTANSVVLFLVACCLHPVF